MRRSLKNVAKEVFKSTIATDDTDSMVINFNRSASRMVDDLRNRLIEYRSGNYPGEKVIKDGIDLIQKTTTMSKAMDVFQYVKKHEDEYLDFAEDYPPIKAFFEGEQQGIWDKTQNFLSIFDESRSYVLDEKVESVVKRMESISEMPSPYNNIKELPELNERFLDSYNEILDKELAPVLTEIENAEKRVMDVLKQSGLEEVFSNRFKQSFNSLIERAKSCNNVAKVNGFRIEADRLKIRFLNEITREQDRIAKRSRCCQRSRRAKKCLRGCKASKRQRNLSIRDLNVSNSWRIETKDDIEKYLQSLKEKLEDEITENTILNIEF